MKCVAGRTVLVALVVLFAGAEANRLNAQPNPDYTIAFAHFGPRNTDLFIADSDGQNAEPLAADGANDYNAMRANGSDVRRLTDDAYEHGTVAFVPTKK